MYTDETLDDSCDSLTVESVCIVWERSCSNREKELKLVRGEKCRRDDLIFLRLDKCGKGSNAGVCCKEGEGGVSELAVAVATS